LLAGCHKDTSSTIVDQNKLIYSGSDGIVMEFGKNAPPERIQAGQTFPLIVTFYNKGAEDVIGGYYLLTGETPTFSGLGSRTALQTIQGKKTLPTEGGFYLLPAVLVQSTEFKTSIYDQETLKANVHATVCYPYKTTLQAPVCIDPQNYGYETIEPSCEMGDLKFDSQGAPIAITELQPSIVTDATGGKKVQFKILFANVGKGMVLSPGYIAQGCDNSITGDAAKDIYGKVQITGSLSGTPITCDIINNAAQGTRTMSQTNPEVNFFECASDTSLLVNRRSAFTTDATFTLTYGYTETITSTIDVAGIPE
jgi:hypothetical protein